MDDALNTPRVESLELSLSAKLGAVLLVSPRPLSSQLLAEATEREPEEVERVLEELREQISTTELGFCLERIAGGWQLRSDPRASDIVARVIRPRGRRLTKAASETLAIIAYKQPVGKAEIESIRGVDATPTLRTLLDLKLIRGIGRQDAPGHPMLYGTTDHFLEKFGLNDLSDLPSLRELEELAEEGNP